ncbi:MAG: GMP/IMP nucleotidase [Gammaproteobacteria bacterium]|nr:GMP/IMP nucleotidase [Gammaproteobacteria bacterium]
MPELVNESVAESRENSKVPPWSQIETVMFDMDGTLLDLHFDNYFWQTFLPSAWARSQGMDLETASSKLHEMYTELRGTLNWYCLDFWAEQLQLNITLLKHEVKDKIAIRPNVIDLLVNLRQLDKRILLITNAHPDSLNLKMQHTGIDRYFHKTISSHELRLAKENHGFWARLMELEHYDPQHTVLIDDSLAVLRQADREGIRYLYGIYQPDSQQDPLLLEDYPQIIDFEHIMPAARDSEQSGPG